MNPAEKTSSLVLLSAVVLLPLISHNAFYLGTLNLSLGMLFMFSSISLLLMFRVKLRANRDILLIFAYALAVLAAAAVSENYQFSLKITQTAQAMAYPAVALIAYNNREFIRRRIGFFAAVVLLILSAAGYYQFICFRSPVDCVFNDAFASRVYSLLGNPDYFAGLLIVFIPVSAMAGRFGKAAAAAAIPLIFATGSLTAVGILLLQIISIVVRGGTGKKALLIMIIPAVFAAGFFVYQVKSEKAGSLGIRADLASAAVRMTLQKPVFGSGPGSFVLAAPKFMDSKKRHDEAYAHNDYLQAFAETGIAGGILFLLTVIMILISSYRSGKYYFASAFGFAVFMIFNFGASMPFVFVLFFTVAGITARGRDTKFPGYVLILPAVLLVLVSGIVLKQSHVRYKLLAALESKHNPRVMDYIEGNSAYIKSDYLSSFYSGAFYSVSGNDVKALEYYLEAVRNHPNFSGALYNTGNVLLRAKRSAEAAVYYERATEVAPEDFALYYNYSRALAGAGRHEEAQKWLERANKLQSR